LSTFVLEPTQHSRSALLAVIVAHVAAALLAVQLFEARRYIEPAPLVVDLLPAPEEKVDEAPAPLPQAVEEVRKVEPEPEPPKPEPVVREEPKPIERVIVPEPAPEVVQPPPRIEPPTPPAPPPMPEPVAVTQPQPAAITVPVPPAPAPEPEPPLVVEVPEITLTAQMLTAVYLRNPKPSYPGISRRLGEQGTVLLRVYVTAVGDAARVELKASSGYPRLDTSAQDAVHRWKFVPAKRGEQPVDAWVLVPIKFSLKG